MGEQVHGGLRQHQRSDVTGVGGRQVKSNHAAATPAHHGGGIGPEGIQQSGGITGVVFQPSGRGSRRPRKSAPVIGDDAMGAGESIEHRRPEIGVCPVPCTSKSGGPWPRSSK